MNFEGDRLLGKDGTFNVRKGGIGWLERLDVFHSLITMPWPRFLFVMLAGYLAMNLLFTALYVAVGIEGLAGVVADSDDERLLEAFFFSAQTLTTVGYGRVNPIGFGAEVVARCEAFVGLMGFALATGLLYGRFSLPRTMLAWSGEALVSAFRGWQGGDGPRGQPPRQPDDRRVGDDDVFPRTHTRHNPDLFIFIWGMQTAGNATILDGCANRTACRALCHIERVERQCGCKESAK